MRGEALAAERTGGREALPAGRLRGALPLESERLPAGFAEETACPAGTLLETPERQL